jgi:hypothetical protein
MPKAKRGKKAPKYLYAATTHEGSIIEGEDGDVLVQRTGNGARARGVEELGQVAGGAKPLRYVLESSVRPGGK